MGFDRAKSLDEIPVMGMLGIKGWERGDSTFLPTNFVEGFVALFDALGRGDKKEDKDFPTGAAIVLLY